jgi:hypothetical protein
MSRISTKVCSAKQGLVGCLFLLPDRADNNGRAW